MKKISEADLKKAIPAVEGRAVEASGYVSTGRGQRLVARRRLVNAGPFGARVP